jgi:hypothetical protein
MTWIVPPVDGLVETAVAPVIWVDGIGAIAMTGDAVSVYYYGLRYGLQRNKPEKQVEVIIKRSPSTFMNSIGLAASATGLFNPPTKPLRFFGRPYVVK